MDPNENEQIFAADPHIDRRERERSREAEAEQRRTAKSVSRSPAAPAVSEESPLLGNGENGVGRDGDSDAESEPAEWFGTAEIKNLPWWKRPSVRPI